MTLPKFRDTVDLGNQNIINPGTIGTAGARVTKIWATDLEVTNPIAGPSLKIDTTSLAFDSTSPVTMFSTGAADIIDEVDVIVDTAFDGTPSLSIGITGSINKYMSATQVDLTAAATTTFKVCSGLAAQGIEALIATYAAGGATVGAARINVKYVTPN